jgi:putative transcriptional regulator
VRLAVGWLVFPRVSMRLLIVAAAMVVSASALRAALPTSPDVSGPDSLAGQLLIATAALHGPPFERTVILVVQHSKGGALGIVINRPLEERSIANLLEAFGADASGVSGKVRVYLGGPVDPQIGFVLHSADYHSDDDLDIDGRLALATGPEILRDIGLGRGPRQSLITFGYAGWGPSQLDDELLKGVWTTTPEDPTLVFEDDRTKVWTDAMARHKPGP